MRRALLACLLPIMFGPACNCGRSRGLGAATPKLALSPPALDFGTVCTGGTGALTLQVANDGQAPLDISSWQVINSLFAAAAPASPIAPGESEPVTVTFTPADASNQAGEIRIATDDPARPSATVALSGTGFAGRARQLAVTCGQQNAPCAFLDFGTITAGKTEDRSAVLANQGCGDLHVFSVSLRVADPACADCASDPSMFQILAPISETVLHGGGSQPLTIRFAPPPGRDSTPAVQAVIRSDDASSEMVLGLFANAAAPALELDPTRLSFFDATQGNPATHSFIIFNTGAVPLTIGGVSLLHHTPGYSLKLAAGTPPFTLAPNDHQPGGPDQAAAAVTFAPQGQGAALDSVLVTATDGESDAVQLFGGTYPQVAVLPDPIDFGQTPMGAKGLQKLVTLSNAGTADLHVSQIALVSNPAKSFSLTGVPSLPLTLPASQSASFTVNFSDNVNVQNDGATLGIGSDDPNYASNGNVFDVSITSQNTPDLAPVAIIGPIGSATAGQPLALDGTQSYSPSGQAIRFQWKVALKPQNARAVIQNDTSATASLTPDLAGGWQVVLTVSDSFGQSSQAATYFKVQAP